MYATKNSTGRKERGFMAFEIGTWAEIPTPYVSDILLSAGLDFFIIDMEHGVFDFNVAQNMVFVGKGRGKKVFIRVPAVDEAWILRALDTGCDGLVYPQVSDVETVKKIIEYSFFSPVGKRGFNPYISAGNYSAVPADYFERENQRITTTIILEGKNAIEQLDEILAIPEVDVIYIGQYDLSVALGIPGQVNHPELLEIMEFARKKILSAGKKIGCMVHSADEAKKMISQGYEFIVYKVDSALLHDCVDNLMREVKANESF